MTLHAPSPTIPGTAGYATEATTLAAQYESIAFVDVHRDVLHLFPQPPSRVVDLGAGSGRDAAALARAGHHVVAVEPTALRLEGQRIHAGLPIEWVEDHLPALAVLHGGHRHFDLVLLTAVWMHLDATEREHAMRSVAALVAPGGRVVMSLRHGPVPEGRRMFDVSAQDTAAQGARYGLDLLYSGRREDTQGRADVHWSVLVLERPAQPAGPGPTAG